MNKTIDKRIFLVMIVAFLLRIFFFRTGETFVSSDEVFLFQNSLKPLTFFLDFSPEHYVAELFRFFNFNWGWVTLAVSTVSIFLLSLIGIPITETTINLPYIFIGVATIYLFYLFGSELGNKRVGIIAALLLSISPTHTSTSRSIGLIGIVATFFFVLTLYLFLKYFTEGKNKNSSLLILGLYFVTDFQFYGILPLITILGLLVNRPSSLKWRLNSIRNLVCSKSLLLFFVPALPSFFGAAYLFLKGFGYNAYVLHIFQKKSYMGVFLFNTIYELYMNVGPALFILFIGGLIYAIFKMCCFKIGKMHYFILIWVFIHSLPWLFVVNPQFTAVSVYLMHLTSAFIFLSAFFVDDLLKFSKNKIAVNLIMSVILLLTLLVTVSVVYRINILSPQDELLNIVSGRKIIAPIIQTPMYIHFGVAGKNTGMKSAGYFLRENAENNSTIFSDQESFVTEYYTGRRVVGTLDLFTENEILGNYEYYKKNGVQIDYVYLENRNYTYLQNMIVKDGFQPLVIIIRKNLLLGTLYGKNSDIPVVRLDVTKTDELFDSKYGNIQSLYVEYT